ncbi:TlpA family protein disulfide reductase [Roseateles oligotrophus]|uniref:TlpA family protein disulfide reductase n=1 Tax=Roseateles oligotrophus TaxID=1769250 RepID=A0ABT2YE97_9BURK|nr:TlpA disulfide reductase family protein [Roseateles oligotrophus]MCV2368349.1 TlpA family protein disulfide reductase [Roseateles oligotrophus]
MKPHGLFVLLLTCSAAQGQISPGRPAATATAAAPVGAAVGGLLELRASNMKGERFESRLIKGKVALVFYWSTACAVCRDSLPEMRANLAGWRNKPFVLLTVNMDSSAEDWLRYEALVSQTQPGANSGMMALRQEGSQPMRPKLPLTLVIDGQQRVIARYEGRVAPEAWDAIADLLP